MGTLHAIDLVIIAIYFFSLIAIGYYVMISKKTTGETESFLAADRNMGIIRTTGSCAATDIGGGFSIAMGGLGFSLGFSGSWLMAVSALSAVLAAFLMVPKVKRWADRVKGLTTGDLFAARFGNRTGLMAAILVGLSWFTFVGGQVIAGAKLVSGVLGLPVTLTIIVAGAVILTYTAMGGLKAVMSTDVFQLVVLLVGIVLIAVPIGFFRVGGIDGLVDKLSASPESAMLLDWGAVSWKEAVGWFLSIFPVWFISIATVQRVIAAKDERTAKLGVFLTGFPIEWPLFAVGTTLIGMFARALLPDLADPELATPALITAILPVGLTGLVVAAYIAAVLSTADSCLVGSVAIFVNDIYRKLINPDANDGELVRVSRIATIVLGILAIGLAYMVPRIIELVLYAYTFGAAGLFFPMLALLFWKRATAAGAFWSILLGGGSAVLWTIAGQPYGLSGSYAGWIISFVTLVAVSLKTDHVPGEQVELFFSKE
ncbi:MAG TPA: sodium:solute symporter family protein [Synergistaceae bacterium]|nr:sodium:solute symporter family protein [Synergistaceae bacterium]